MAEGARSFYIDYRGPREKFGLPNGGHLEVTRTTPEHVRPGALPVVIFPGLTENATVLEDVAQVLFDAGRPVIVCNYSGPNKSEELMYDAGGLDLFTIHATEALAVNSYLKAKNIEQVDALSHSKGSLPAAIAAAFDPKRYRHMVLDAPSGFNKPDTFPRIAWRTLAIKGGRDIKSLFSTGDAGEQRAIRRLLFKGDKKPWLALREGYDAAHSHIDDLVEFIDHAGIKVAVITHGDDPIFPPEQFTRNVRTTEDTNIRWIDAPGKHDALHYDASAYAARAERAFTEFELDLAT